MTLLHNYIARNILGSTLLAFMLLLALFGFFAFIDQLDDVGRGRYGVPDAAEYVLFTLPRLAYQMMPIAVLLGGTVGLGILASNSELTAIRAAGISLWRIVGSVMRVGAVFVAITLLLGEWIAPATEQVAQAHRSLAISGKLSLQGDQGMWARDGNRIINIRKVLPGGRLGGVYIYELDSQQRMRLLVHAESAIFRDSRWVLDDVRSSEFREGGVYSDRNQSSVWLTQLSPDLLAVVSVKPETLSIAGLYRYINYLRDNRLESISYEKALWGKLTQPLVTALMMLLAVPFVFGSLRSVGIAHRIMAGTLLGVTFHLFSQMFSHMGVVFHLWPPVVALVPPLLLTLLTIFLFRRVN